MKNWFSFILALVFSSALVLADDSGQLPASESAIMLPKVSKPQYFKKEGRKSSNSWGELSLGFWRET